MNKAYLEAAKGEDLSDLLSHIAWTDVVRPALSREREMYTKFLVEATLGRSPVMQTSAGPKEMTKEQLAGRIYGIDYITDLFEKVITKGHRALDELKSRGVNLN